MYVFRKTACCHKLSVVCKNLSSKTTRIFHSHFFFHTKLYHFTSQLPPNFQKKKKKLVLHLNLPAAGSAFLLCVFHCDCCQHVCTWRITKKITNTKFNRLMIHFMVVGGNFLFWNRNSHDLGTNLIWLFFTTITNSRNLFHHFTFLM